MATLRFTLFFLGLLLAGYFALSCGASHGQLQSITLSPATADAHDYPNEQVQFTDTGYYIHPSYTVTPQPATWGACYRGAPTTDVSVTTGGTAQCANGATGTYSVFASVPLPGTTCAINGCGEGCTIVGTAQLTCP